MASLIGESYPIHNGIHSSISFPRFDFREYAVTAMTSSMHDVLHNKETKLVMVDGNTTLLDLFKAYRRRVKIERALLVS